ncbi:MAG: 5-dehydro-2-deoxygluconokinase [Anaerolineae bacterium]|nr:5-dehydro-2-deoxygluconokinase [Thermoflexales bacterium]MDW8395964.1 5-dehydro-2-deoxygluconokinase [Anaerolineae bacterium]
MSYDTLHMGRSSIDLYSDDIGAPFVEITRFAAFVGGSPTNISVGVRRLGLRSALLTAVGDDLVGDFVLHFLQREGVETRFIPRKPGYRTSAVLLGIQPPDRFPLVFYRERCADAELTIDDVLAAPVTQVKVFQFVGTNLSREPSRSATLFAAEQAKQAGATVVLDVDFRPDQWHDPRAFGVAIRAALHTVDVVIATDDELNAAMMTDPAQLAVVYSQLSDARVAGDAESAVRRMLGAGVDAVVRKRGVHGSRVYLRDGSVIDAAAFPVEVVNILGAGDAFAAGLIYGLVNGWDWYRSARLANACGAILVTKQGCANFMPTLQEAMDFINARGGL